MQEVVKTYLRYAYYTTRDTQAEADRRRGEERKRDEEKERERERKKKLTQGMVYFEKHE